ncbi:MAG: chitosanase [Deltaproteobacteria bacterium]|nr:chitosanase [Deltaproteobacteria bacterium]
MRERSVLLAVIGASLASCGDTAPGFECPAGQACLSPAVKHRAEALISLFENGTVEIQYGYSEALGDGRGITAGKAGFTTATGDALEVIELYTAGSPGNALAGYLPRLRELEESGSGSTDGLDGYAEAWAAAALDPAFREAQDRVTDELYYLPAMGYALDLGLELPLSRAVLYDTIIQHGDGENPDGLAALLSQTLEGEGRSPADGLDEDVWLRAFLEVRRAVLEHADDPDTREEWAESVPRVEAWAWILDQGNTGLEGPFVLDSDHYTETIP